MYLVQEFYLLLGYNFGFDAVRGVFENLFLTVPGTV